MESKLHQIQQACVTEDAYTELLRLVYSFSGEGLTRQNIYNLFLEYLKMNQQSGDWLRVASKFNGDHPVENILDCLGGFCLPHQVLLPDEPCLPN